MKRILALILAVLSATLLMASPAFAAEEKTDFDFLKAFGIVKLAEGVEIEPENTVSRIELAEIFYNIIFPSIENGVAEGGKDFSDVPADKKHIAAAVYGMGVMRGYSEEVFAPFEAVTYAQAVKAIVSFLGYDLYAQNMGGYPSGYLSQAVRLQILSGNVSGDAFVTYGQIASILKKALKADVAIWDNTSPDGSATLRVLEGINYLKYYRGISVAKGQLTGNYLTSIKNGKATGFFSVIVGGEVMEVSESAHGIQNLLGFNVHVYYTEDNGYKTILYYEEGQNNVVEIAAQNIISVSNGSIRYYEDGSDNACSAAFGLNASLIYNGSYEKSYSVNDINPFAAGTFDGFIKLIDFNNDSVYDTIVVTAYKSIVVNDLRNNKIYGKYNLTGNVYDKVVDLTHYKERNINIRNLNGGAAELSDIKPGYIVSLCYDKKGEIKEIIVTKDVITGTIEELSYSGGKLQSVKMNNITFSVSNVVSVIDTAGKMAPGVTAEFYFGSKGEIVVIDIDSQFIKSYKTGYLVDAGITGGIEKTVVAMIFDTEGTMKTYELAPKVKMNMTSVLAEDVLTAFGTSSGRVKRQVILYKTDDKGEKILSIELATKLEEGDKAFDGFYQYPGESFYYVGGFKSFSHKYVANAETVAFGIPSEEQRDDYELYTMVTLPSGEGANYGKDTAPVTMQLYGTKKNGMVVDIAVVNDTGSAGDTSRRPYFIVSSVSTIIGEDGEECTKITGTYVQGVATTSGSFTVANTVLAAGHNMGVSGDANNGKKPFINQNETRFTPGDVLRVNEFSSTGGKISRIDVGEFYQIYDFEDNVFMNASGYILPESATHYVYGRVVDRDGSTIMIQLPDSSYRTFDLSAGKYGMVEVTKNPRTGEAVVKGASYECILSEQSHPGEGSRVVIHYRGTGIGCFVYNDGR